MMTINNRFSKDDELDSTFLNSMMQRYSNTTSSNNPSLSYNRNSRSGTNYSSPFTDISERSESVPISPIHPLDYRENIEVAQMELELQFKTLEMLALIKGTTPRLAFEAERQEEIRSQRGRSTDVEDFDSDEEDDDDAVRVLLNRTEVEEDAEGEEYLIGESYVDVDDITNQLNSFHTSSFDVVEDSDAEEDIFGMEL
mmetsp:Transcript_30106/g.32812  ORF Transcript_30106/g.32812 Transcript_30106/m.32812 type:complete len:198 (+) Transcript_30106:87-680(+)